MSQFDSFQKALEHCSRMEESLSRTADHFPAYVQAAAQVAGRYDEIVQSIETASAALHWASQLEQVLTASAAVPAGAGVFLESFQNAVSQLDKIDYDGFSRMLRMWETALPHQVDRVLSAWSSLDPEILTLAKSFDTAQIQMSETGSIVHEGKAYDEKALSVELERQIEAAKPGKVALKDRFEKLKEKLWLLLLIVQLIVFLPQVPETAEFYKNTVSQIQEVIQHANKICFTIRDSSYIRENASSNAAILLTLPYDTPLEIIADVPRWYQVTFTDENGDVHIGWISKISVETGGL